MSAVEKLRKMVLQMAGPIEHLYEVIVTDRDGVPIFRCTVDNSVELTATPPFLSTQAVAIDQLAKIGVGKLKQIAFFYNQYQVVILQYEFAQVTLTASSSANTSQLFGIGDKLAPLIKSLQDLAAGATVH